MAGKPRVRFPYGGYSAGQPIIKNGIGGYFSPYFNPRLTDGPSGEYLTERMTSDACKFIHDHKNDEKPFFLNYWLYNVHIPLQAQADKIEKYKNLVKSNALQTNAVYAAMVEHLDDAVGSVLSKLKEDGLYENTIVIFYSDNGGLIGKRRATQITNNYPLRSGKGDMFEGGIRVPFIIRWPGKIHPGMVNEQPIISVDPFPTLLGLTKTKIPVDKLTKIDGGDLCNTISKSEKLPIPPLYWHYPHYHPEGAKPYGAIRLGNWKLIEVLEQPGLQLYNLKDDIGERNDLSLTYPKKANELYSLLKKWRTKMNAQMPTTNPAYDPTKTQ